MKPALLLALCALLPACRHRPSPDASLFPDDSKAHDRAHLESEAARYARLEHENAAIAARLLNR